MKYLLPDKLYNILKWTGLILCPALGLFYQTIAPVWGLPYQDAIVITLQAIGVLIGTLIGVSQITATEIEGSDI